MSKTEGYFLVSHGSKSPRSLAQVQEVASILEKQLGMPIGCGCLEGLETDLTTQIKNWLDRQRDRLVVVPLFLWQGEHTSRDIPLAVQKIDRLKIAPHLGSYPQIENLLGDRFLEAEQKFIGGLNDTTQRLLIVHGSSYPSALAAMENLANSLHARLAFWNIPNSIGDSIEHLLGEGCDRILALPYFLFPGKITQAIGEMLKPYSQVQYLPVPFTTTEIADFIARETGRDTQQSI